MRSTQIEELLFGEIDRQGSAAIGYWAGFTHPSLDRNAINGLLHFMSAQTLRTPKGLDWLVLTRRAGPTRREKRVTTR